MLTNLGLWSSELIFRELLFEETETTQREASEKQNKNIIIINCITKISEELKNRNRIISTNLRLSSSELLFGGLHFGETETSH